MLIAVHHTTPGPYVGGPVRYNRCVGDRYGVALLLYNLGARLLHMNQMPQARANLRESMTTYQELGEATGCIECLEQLAAIAITQSRSAVAAQLLGAAECQRIALGSPCAPSEQAEVDHMVAAIRRQLSTSQFTAAWAQGAALTLEQALALARGDERST